MVAVAWLVSAAAVGFYMGASLRPQPPHVRFSSATASVDAVQSSPVVMSTTGGIGDPWLVSAATKASPPTPDVEGLRASGQAALRLVKRPNRKAEAWRRFDFSLLFGAELEAPSSPVDSGLASTFVDGEDAKDGGLACMVFVDGVFSAELSSLDALPSGTYAGSLSGFEEGRVRTAVEASVHQLPEAEADRRTELGIFPFAALNQASLSDVGLVYVPKGCESTLRIVHLSTGAPTPDTPTEPPAPTEPLPKTVFTASHPNTLIWVDEGASLSVLQQYAGAGRYFTNALTRVHVAANASVQHSYVQEASLEAVHLDSLVVHCDERADYRCQAVQTGGRLSRVNHQINLAGRLAHSDLSGLTLASDRQLCDFHSQVRHVSRDCSSAQEQRNAAAGRSRIVFKGAIQVPRGSDNTSATQLCNSLLLSDKARVDMEPTLEIKTDDVQCTHGATVCDLDDEMIFYLQARGLDRVQARSLLLAGWARSVMDRVPSAAAKERVVSKAALLAPETLERSRRQRGLSSI